MWTEANNVLSDTQNGFRRDRNCQDYLFTLSSIIETRLKTKKDTFACFIDMRKAFDRINRNLLWYKLKTLGLPDHFFFTIQSLYNQVQGKVRVNNNFTDWFPIETGVKQGCLLSPLLFDLYVNDLALELSNTG